MEAFIILLHGDISFTKKERQIIDRAIDAWFYFTQGLFLFHVVYDLEKTDLDMSEREDVILKVNSGFHHVQLWDANFGIEGYGFCSFRAYQSVIHLVTDRFPNERAFQKVIMHELGHHLGMGHVSHGIMQRRISGEEQFSEWDAEELCQVYGFRLEELSFSKG